MSLAFFVAAHVVDASEAARAARVSSRQTAEHTTVVMEQTFDYLRYLPPGYEDDANKRWPLLLFLHGAGERGDDVAAFYLRTASPSRMPEISTTTPMISLFAGRSRKTR